MHDSTEPRATSRSVAGDPFAGLELVPDAVLVHRRGSLLFANQAARGAFGLGDGEPLEGRLLRDLVDAATLAAIEADAALLEGGRSAVRRRRVRTADGAVRTLEAHAREVDAGGSPATLVVLRDVSEAEALREALGASEQRWRAAFTALGEAVFVHDHEGRLLAHNAAAERLLGLSEAILAGREPKPAGWRLRGADGHDVDRSVREEVVRTGEGVRGLPLVCEDGAGGRRHLTAHLEPVRDDTRAVVGVVSTFADVTDHVVAQQRALDEARLRGLSDRINEAELVVATDGRIVAANERAGELYGRAPDDLVGRDIRDLRAPWTRADVASQMAIARETGHRFETEHVRSDGRAFPVAVSSRAFEVGGQVYLHSLVRDLTVERRADRAQRVLAGLVAAMADAVVVSDDDHRVTEWTGGAEAIFGWSREEALGKNLLTDFESERRPDDDAVGLARIERGEPVRVEVRVRRKDGSFADLDMHVERLRGPDGRLDGTLTVARDVGPAIAARRAVEASEQRLRAAEADLRAVLASVPDPVLVVQAARVAFANEAALRLFDAPAARVLGRPLFDFVPEDEWADCRADAARIAVDQGIAGWRRVRRPDGTRCDVELRAAPVRFDGGQAVVAVLRERTAVDEARRALRASEEELRSTFAAMAEGVVVQTRDGRIVRANAAAERILGLTREQLDGRTSVDPRWRAVHEDGSDYPGDAHPAMRTLRSGEPCPREVMGVRTPEGELRWISIASEPLRDAPGGLPYAVVTTFADVTAIRRTHDELREALANVKTLTGFLPICMYCKNVRDDAGYWQRLEHYITEHSGALVSHGLCPTCARERFPEVFADAPEER